MTENFCSGGKFPKFPHCAVWKNEKFSLTKAQCGNFEKFSPTAIIFRQIDLQYNSLVKKLIWRNFCKISWGKNLQISTLCSGYTDFTWKQFWRKENMALIAQCGNLQFFSPTIYCKNSVKLTFSLKSYTVNQFDEKFFSGGKFPKFPHCHCASPLGFYVKSIFLIQDILKMPFWNFSEKSAVF